MSVSFCCCHFYPDQTTVWVYYITDGTIILPTSHHIPTSRPGRFRWVPTFLWIILNRSKIFDFCIIPLTATSVWLRKSSPIGRRCCNQKDLLSTPQDRNVFILVVFSPWQGSTHFRASNFEKVPTQKASIF